MSFNAGALYTFNPDTHEYKVGERLVPSCTGVLSQGGLVPHRYVDDDILERKSDLGRESHKACHLFNVGKLLECDGRVKPYLESWLAFRKEAKSFTLISSEYQTVTQINGMFYGMRLDVNALIDREDTIIELKTGIVYPHHGVQTAGYAAGLPHPKWTTPVARFLARKRIVVELRPTGIPKVHRYEERSDYEVFVSLLHVASWKKKYHDTYKGENA